jgi:hypothetical protein
MSANSLIATPAHSRFPWSLKGDDCEEGDIFVATATQPLSMNGFDFEITDVRDLPGPGAPVGEVACDIVGTWIVDNNSLDLFGTSNYVVDYINGEIRVTFLDEEASEGDPAVVEYDNFEYRTSLDVTLGDVGGRKSRSPR